MPRRGHTNRPAHFTSVSAQRFETQGKNRNKKSASKKFLCENSTESFQRLYLLGSLSASFVSAPPSHFFRRAAAGSFAGSKYGTDESTHPRSLFTASTCRSPSSKK